MTSRLYLTASVAPLVPPCFRALMYRLAALQGGSSRLIPGLLRLMCLLLTSTGRLFLGAGRHSCCSLDAKRSGERAARHVGFPRDIGLLYCDNTDATSTVKYFLWTSPCGSLIYEARKLTRTSSLELSDKPPSTPPLYNAFLHPLYIYPHRRLHSLCASTRQRGYHCLLRFPM